MGADLVSWIFHSPRRLVVAAVVVLLAALGLGGGLSRLSGAGGSSGPAPTASALPDVSITPSATEPVASSSGAGSISPTPVAGVSGAQAPDAAPFVAAAVQFTRVWARLQPGETAAQWHDRVDPLVTAELAAALQLTDPASLPGAAPTGSASVRYLAETSALVAVPLTNGSTVLVTVVSQGGRWPVSDVQPDVGDAGDVGGRGQATASATGPIAGPATDPATSPAGTPAGTRAGTRAATSPAGSGGTSGATP